MWQNSDCITGKKGHDQNDNDTEQLLNSLMYLSVICIC